MDRSLVAAFMSIFVGRFGSLSLSIVITPILVRLLGSGPYGDYAFIMSSLAIVSIITNWGITDGVRKFLAEDRNHPQWDSEVFGFYTKFGIAALGIVIAFIALLSASGLATTLLGSRLAQYTTIFCMLLVVNQFNVLARNTLMGLGLERLSEPMSILRRLIFGIVAIGLVLLGAGATGALIGEIAGFGVAAALMIGYISRELDWEAALRRTADIVPKRRLLQYNSSTVLLILLSTTLYHIDVVLIRTIVGDNATGLYKGALVIAEFLWFIPIMLQTLLVHSTSELWSRDASDKVTDLASRITRYTILATLLPLIGLAALADVFIPLYLGPEFERAVVPMLLLLPGVFGLSIAKPIYAIGQGKGQFRALILATGTAALLNLALNLVLIPRYGMNGAAIATSCGYGSMALLHAIAAQRIGFNPLGDLRPVPILVTVVLSAIVITAVSATIATPLYRLVIVPPVGLTVYVTLALLTGSISSSERAIIYRKSRSIFRIF